MKALTNNTLFNYVVAIAATFIATKLGWAEADTADLMHLGIAFVVQGTGLWTAYRGVAESRRDKVVVDGKRVLLDDLTHPNKVKAEEIVLTAPRRRKTLMDLIKGK